MTGNGLQGNPNWVKGKSGNPKGRPPGLKHQEFFEKIIKEHRVDLLNLAIDKAKKGKSPIILKFLLERFIPKVALAPLEYQKLQLECAKLEKENRILDEAPDLLDMLKEDPEITQRIKDRLRIKKRELSEDSTTDV